MYRNNLKNKLSINFNLIKENKIVQFVLLISLFVFSLYFAYLNKFLQDDAFITFRYSENWSNGLGPVFNQGEKIEGYTNFLWMFIIALCLNFIKDPIVLSHFWGIVFYFITLLCYYRISISFFSNAFLSILFLFLLGTNYSLSSYATGGLETSLASALLALTLFLINKIELNKIQNIYLFLISIVLSLLILTRLDFGLVVALIYIYIIYRIFFIEIKDKFKRIIILSAPLTLLVGFYLLWKYLYYKNLLPNTFNAKLNGGSDYNILSGLDFLLTFITTYWLGLPILFLLSLVVFRKVVLNTHFEKILLILLLLVTFYVVSIGGDFMEFRFFVPYIPILFLILIKQFYISIGIVGVLSLGFSLLFSSMNYRFKDKKKLIQNLSFSGIESILNLQKHLTDPLENWIFIGKEFRKTFKDTQIKISVGPAGAIPYYSKLYSLDMLGLNDENVKDPKYFDTFPAFKSGHKKFSKLSYLKKKNIQLVISNPVIFPSQYIYDKNPSLASLIESKIDLNINNKYSLIKAFFPLIDLEELKSLNELRFLWIPLNKESRLLVLYLCESEELDTIIERNKWDSFIVKFN